MKIEHIAKLAKLSLSEKEKKELEKDFKRILEFVEKLKEIDTSKINILEEEAGLKNVLREDKASPQKTEPLTLLFPKKEKGYLKVKKIL